MRKILEMKKLRIILFILLFAEIVYFFYLETNSIEITVQDIEDNELANVIGGVKVVHISDLHVKKAGRREKRLVELMRQIDPDIIFITGDFLLDNRLIEPCIETLRCLSDYLVVAVLGNSDYLSNGKNVNTEVFVEEIRGMGIKVLMNEAIKVTISRPEYDDKSCVYIIGLDDNYLGFDDIFTAMNNVPGESPKILLAHTPNIVEKIKTDGINLILSGHTHGGQICLPFIGPVYYNGECNARKKYYSGLFKEDIFLYVNRGIGTSLIPVRLFCRPEITVFRFI
jgi:predicted MPP superfamily phosphohydrolase